MEGGIERKRAELERKKEQEKKQYRIT